MLDQNAGTVVVNGQRFAMPTYAGSYAPVGFGPQTSGVPLQTPNMPPFIGGPAGGGMGSVSEDVGGYGTAGNNAYAAQLAQANPWNWKVSPVIWAIVGLLLSIFLLRHVHWRDTLIEGKEAVGIGPAREEAGAEA